MSVEPVQPSMESGPGKAAAYLVACGLPPAKANECVASFAAHPQPPDATLDPTAEIVDALDDWAMTLPCEDEPDLSPEGIARSRARLLLVGLPACPSGLCHGPLPPGMPDAIARANLQVTPDLHQTSMTAQPLDLGPLSEVADETWRTFDKWPFLRGVAIWTLFLGLLVAVLVTIRF